MKILYCAVLLCLVSFAGNGQKKKLQKDVAIKDVNYKYKYETQHPIRCYLRPVADGNKVRIYYRFKITRGNLADYAISWEKRTSLTQLIGTPVENAEDNLLSEGVDYRDGFLTVDSPQKPWLIVAKMTELAEGQRWFYHAIVEKTFPINGWLEQNGRIAFAPYVSQKDSVFLRAPNSKPFFVRHYRDQFMPPSPPYVDHENRAPRYMFQDSVMRVKPSSRLRLKNIGLYLFQQDSNSAQGFSYRAMPSVFPKFARIDELAQPLIYVCSPDESRALETAGNDKAAFDQVILAIVGSKEAAGRFMRQYFQRVEAANLLFSSYKAGWKTDQGMIYIVFGPPNRVRATATGESWIYSAAGAEFVFVRNGTVYDPNYMVLIRDKIFEEPWFTMVDRVRRAKF